MTKLYDLIDGTTKEGKLLIAAISRITEHSQVKKTLDQILEEVKEWSNDNFVYKPVTKECTKLERWSDDPWGPYDDWQERQQRYWNNEPEPIHSRTFRDQIEYEMYEEMARLHNNMHQNATTTFFAWKRDKEQWEKKNRENWDKFWKGQRQVRRYKKLLDKHRKKNLPLLKRIKLFFSLTHLTRHSI